MIKPINVARLSICLLLASTNATGAADSGLYIGAGDFSGSGEREVSNGFVTATTAYDNNGSVRPFVGGAPGYYTLGNTAQLCVDNDDLNGIAANLNAGLNPALAGVALPNPYNCNQTASGTV